MADTSNIAWCDSTINLWVGCTQLSPACDHCYAMLWGPRLKVPWNGPPKRLTESSWSKIEAYQRAAPRFFKLHGRRRRVFINSLSDFFDKQAQQEWRLQAATRMEMARDVVFILVTKRPQNVVKMVPSRWLSVWPENIWLLTTAENQVEFVRRTTELFESDLHHVPVRGLSIEPMLERFDLSDIGDITMRLNPMTGEARHLLGLNAWAPPLKWIIFGGESGRHARPYDISGAALMISQAQHAGVAVFSKQLGQLEHPDSFKNFDAFPPALQVRQFPDEVIR